jgi:sugar O-acyltransferase (sialic acid O-acetyltransferase NeuD family)
MKKVVIFGAGPFASVARVYLTKDGGRDVVAFTADPEHVGEGRFDGLDVVSFDRLGRTHSPDEFALFVAIGFRKVNRARAEVFRRCKDKGYELISYVNSRALLWDRPRIGENCFILENNVIQPFVTIGDDVVLWSGNHIGHHATIGDHCFISSHVVISGGVKVGDHTFIGVNATVRDHVTIGPANVIGAGALILEDTSAGAVYAPKGTEVSPVPSHRLRGF